MSSSKARFVFNRSNRTVGFRTSETDKLPNTYVLIDDATANAVVDGQITGDQLEDAIARNIMSKPGFSWEEYSRRRQAEDRLLNVSKYDMRPAGNGADASADPEKNDDVVSLAGLGLSAEAKRQASARSSSGGAKTAPPAEKPTGKSSIDAALGL